MDKIVVEMSETEEAGWRLVQDMSIELWNEARRICGSDRRALVVIADQVMRRHARVSDASCLGLCFEHQDLLESAIRVSKKVSDLGRGLPTDAACSELGDIKIGVFARRTFNAAMAMAMTECRDCAAIVVWSWVCHDAVHVLHS